MPSRVLFLKLWQPEAPPMPSLLSVKSTYTMATWKGQVFIGFLSSNEFLWLLFNIEPPKDVKGDMSWG